MSATGGGGGGSGSGNGGGGSANKMSALRAMFENQNKQDSTPTDAPVRGRSPGVASAASSNGTSPRPLSKVRTSFVAVAATQALGLGRSESTHRDNPARRSAFSMDDNTHPQEMAERRQLITNELEARENSTIMTDSIPEAALETPAHTPAVEVEVEKKLETKTNGTPLAEVEKRPEAKSNGTPANAKPATSTKPANGKTSPTKTATESRTTLRPAAVLTRRSKGPNGISEKSSRPAAPGIAKSAVKLTSSTSSTTKAAPATISANKTTAASTKSPPNAKAPTTPKAAISKQTAPKRIAPPLSKTPEKKPSKSSLSDATRKSPAVTLKAKDGSPSAFVKPKPKSPTRPVRLPASLTAPTASSRSKNTGTTAPPVARSQSRAAGATTSSAGVLRRTQSTTLKKSAIGPPPAKRGTSRPSAGGAADSRPKSAYGSAPPNEGFMARMMRPTASSQSKANEKSPSTPPKKSQPAKRTARQSISRPSTRDSTSGQKAFGGSPKVPKAQTPSSRALESSEKLKEVIAASDPVEESLNTEELAQVPEATLDKVAEVVPETAAEAAKIPEVPVVDAEVDVAPAPEDTVFEMKTECAPVTDKADDLSEEAAPSSEAAPEAEVPFAEEKEKEAAKTVALGETF